MSAMSELAVIREDVFAYLDVLRESGVTNMLGAGAYVQANFDLNRAEAAVLLRAWMREVEAGREVCSA